MISLKRRKRLLTLLLPLLVLFLLLSVLIRPHLQKRCTHIAVITAPNHGMQKLLSSADNCNPVTTNQHLWTATHPSVEEALNVVAVSSVVILQNAFYNHSIDVRTFLRFATGNRVPVILLHRKLEDAWQRNGDWDEFQTDTNTFFRDAKKMMRVAGVRWDEVAFDELRKKWIYVEGHDCYIRNCLV